MSTVAALNSDLGSTNSGSASVSDDTWNNNQLSNQVALEISEHLRNFISVDLNLELRNAVSILEVKIEIVSLVDLLNCFLELKKINSQF